MMQRILHESKQLLLIINPQKKTALIKSLIIIFCTLFCCTILKAQSNKIQQSIDAIKAANYCEDADYHTDGQRIVWVKSYKKWTPEDMPVLKKEAPSVLQFLCQAIQHNRLDVLDQLLPNYYRDNGGIQAFSKDILQISGAEKQSTQR